MPFNRTPTVFVSSTFYDLKQIREDIRDFLQNNYNFDVMLSEFDSFPVDPCIGTFENCLKNVDDCADIFILIVGDRYGTVTEKGKSITNYEYLHAKAKGIPIYIFVSKKIFNNLPLWRKNKKADFSSVVENPQIFEFVSEIYDQNHQWVYTFDSVRDITATLKNQLLLVFTDGLEYKKLVSQPQYSILKADLPSEAARMIIEKPYAWEYKFLAYVLKDEFNKLKPKKWNYKYGLFEGNSTTIDSTVFLNDIKEKVNEMAKLVECMTTIINTVFRDAIGEPSIPSDLELMLYCSRQLASMYERVVEWALYFKSLHGDERYSHLLELLYTFPSSLLTSMDDFVNRFYNETVTLPDVDDGAERPIQVVFSFDFDNANKIVQEISVETTSLRAYTKI